MICAYVWLLVTVFVLVVYCCGGFVGLGGGLLWLVVVFVVNWLVTDNCCWLFCLCLLIGCVVGCGVYFIGYVLIVLAFFIL